MNNNKSIPYTIKTNGSVTLYLNGECLTIAPDHPNYNKIIATIKAGDFSGIENLINVAKAVTQYAKGQVTILNGQVHYGDFALHNTLTNRIIKMMNEGFKFDHMFKFLENILQNPSNRAVNETYTFLENYGLPITDDGCFLAYKAVNNGHKDIYSGKLDNRVGLVVSMPRNMVDEVYERDCSTGLHVGALDYVVQYGHFSKGQTVSPTGNRLLIVKVNPKDVVSVPKYESHPKMRVAEYVVVSEIRDIVKELDKVVYTSQGTDLAPDYVDTTAKTRGPKSRNAEQPTIDTTSAWNEAKYREGWADAQEDLDEHEDYGYGRDYHEVNSYRLGYNDCFNGRPNQAAAVARQGGGEDPPPVSNHHVATGCSKFDINDYDSGYDLGVSDYESGMEFEESLDIDSSDAHKEGYHNGWNVTRNVQ